MRGYYPLNTASRLVRRKSSDLLSNLSDSSNNGRRWSGFLLISSLIGVGLVVIAFGILFVLSLTDAQAAGDSPADAIPVTLSPPCYPGAPDTEVCGGGSGEFFWASVESETPPRDTNWFVFTAEEGWTYIISAFGFIDQGDVAQITLYDGGAVLATDDSTDASGLPFPDAEIVWVAQASGSYLVKFFQPLELAKISLTGQLGIHGQAPSLMQRRWHG